MSQIILHTERLELKGITPALVHELAATKSKEELINYFGFDEKGHEHFMSMHDKGMETYSLSLFYFVIIIKERQLAIGDIGFHTWNAKHSRAELFYNIYDDTNKQKGYMSEALKEVIEFGFTELKLHRIAAMVANWNIPSVKLIKKNGFTFEGTLREDYVVNGVHEDSDCYSLLKNEWRKSIK